MLSEIRCYHETQEHSIPDGVIPLLWWSRNCVYYIGQSVYKRASILLLTSEYEGFGLVVAEAMSHGVVPVGYNSFETAHDLVTDGYNGALIEKPFSVSGFVGRVQELMNKPEYLNKLSKNSRIVSVDYSIDKLANNWYQLMDN